MRTHWLVDILLYILGALFNAALLIVVAFSVLTYAQQGYTLGMDMAAEMTKEGEDREIELVLEEETDAWVVAEMMEELGVISDKWVFRAELFLKNSSKTYQPGTYLLNSSWSNSHINGFLRRPPVEEFVHDLITIPEGYSIRDIAVYLEGRGFMEADEFIEACANYETTFSFLNDVPDRPNRLEGYLFPDTYFINPEPTPNEIIYKMLARFDEIFTSEYRDQAEELGRTIDDMVIIASMIEKEVRVAAERPIVSGVIYNRLRTGMPLQIDATVLFALDKKADRLLFADLEVDSPYNTYKYGGLPIGPIGNPGASCLRAAVYPEEHGYFYYVVKNTETGEHHFSVTFEEHTQASRRYHDSLDN